MVGRLTVDFRPPCWLLYPYEHMYSGGNDEAIYFLMTEDGA
jgi:hypothetical protein